MNQSKPPLKIFMKTTLNNIESIRNPNDAYSIFLEKFCIMHLQNGSNGFIQSY